MIEEILIKLQTEACLLTAVLPRWPNRAWFPLLLQSLIDHPRRLPVKRDLNLDASQLSVPSTTPFSGSARMLTIFDQGFSREVSKRIASGGRRDSTAAIYDSRWEKFSLWCHQRGIDPLASSVSSIADFLLHLFQEENLSSSTLKGYRSAINSVLVVQGRTLADNHHMEQLLKSFDLERPRSVVPWFRGTSV